MKLMQVNDVHTCDRPPRNRTEAYTEESFAELRQVFQLAEREAVDAVAFCGDLFHFPQPSRVSHALVQRWLDEFDRSGLPIVLIAGNHDLPAGRWEDIGKTPIGVLAKHKNATLLQGELARKFGGTIAGVPYMSGQTAEGIADILNGVVPDVLLLHGSIAPKPNPWFYTIHPRELEGFAGVVCYGHMHEPEPLYVGSGPTTVSNPGALSRGTLTDSDLTRNPQVAIVEAHNGDYSVRYVDVPNCKPAEEIFRIETAEVKEGAALAVSAFVEALNSASIERVTVEDLVMTARKMAGEPVVADLAAEVLLGVA